MKAILISVLLTVIPGHTGAIEGMAVQWERIHNGPAGGSVAVDSGGNVIVTRETTLAKYAAASGALLWEKRTENPWIQRLAVDKTDNVIIAGFATGVNEENFYIAKYAPWNGMLLWEKRHNAYVAQIVYLALDDVGNVITTGRSEFGTTDTDIYTAKYAAANGMLVWEHRHDRLGIGRSGEWSNGLAVDREGNVIVCGVSGFQRTPSSRRDLYIAKYAAAAGELIWDTLSRNPPKDAAAMSVNLDGDGNAIVIDHNLCTAKYAAEDGALVWETSFNGPDGSQGRAIGVDSEGNAVVTGYVGNSGDYDIYTAKYAAADGALLWEQRYDGPEDPSDDLSSGLILDPSGNAIVSGSSGGDYLIAKYAAADGTLLWEMRYTDGGAAAVAVDLHGSLIFHGANTGAGPWHTVKYVEVDTDNDGLLDSWEIEHFGNTAGQSALDDTDGDGAVELLELAFGTDPRSPVSVPAPAVVNEGGYLTTTITKQPSVSYHVETSAALEAGFSAASTTVLNDTASTLKVRDNVPVGTQPGRFLRVRVTAPP